MLNKTSISSAQCLTEDQTLRYVEGTMTREEERAVDRHIASCDLCSDAIEGAMLIPKDDFVKHSTNIAQKIDQIFIEKPSNTEGVIQKSDTTLKPIRQLRLLRWVATAAASILVLATLGIWFLTTDAPKNDAVAEAKEIVPDPNQSGLPPQYLPENSTMSNADSTVAAVSEKESLAQGNLAEDKDKTALPKPVKPIVADNAAMPQSAPIVKADNAPVVASAPTEAMQRAESQAVTRDEFSKDVKSYSEKSKVEEAEKDREIGATREMKKAKMPLSAASKKQTVEGNQNIGLFQEGLKYYNKSEYANALGFFNQVLSNEKQKDLLEMTQWYAALANLKNGNKPEAKTLLETTVKEKGKYATQAADVLKKEF